MELGQKLLEAQIESGMTVKAICRKCGYSRPTWYAIIKVKNSDFGNINAESLRKTCELLKVKL
jgi:transcriptional regulator with XRE-family HTH domain